MRILHVMGWVALRYGGPPVVVTQSCRILTGLGHHAEIVTTNVDGPGTLDVPTGRPIVWGGATITFHPLARPRRFLTSWKLLADVWRRSSRFDVVHVNSLYRFHTLAAAAAARHARVPYVLQAHGALLPWNRARKRRAKDLYHAAIEDRVIRGASVILCTSRQEEASIRDLGYETPTAVIPIGIDWQGLREPGSREILATAGIGEEARVVTFLGRVSRLKRVDLLVRAFQRTAAAFPEARLVIAGPDDGGYVGELQSIASANGLDGRVAFVGPVAGPAKRGLLQRSDVLVLPSPGESFGLAAAEALAVGCPVVVSPDVALQELVSQAGAGLVAERDPEDIARAIAVILADPVLSTRMREAAKAVVERRLSWSVVGGQLESMYSDVIRAASPSRTPPADNPAPTAGTPS